ncbi:hypothetical protein [Caloranaerobacter azorensis]|uniref:Uncharacterized protein n=2 Tax=Caloranaerobacter azorensis TaxID=116090 RepID=A0A1M5TG95_9FIRM|nr:hypothetical protein [Caloranaerobacter azorensis]QIB26654.1 hypothetical protein G3A45_04655 [Caloranaerobacter azorensis]SHH49772.1 hypothetical protein SAMN02745135_00990 [Caloranaerobacter azorensis DSM 13643]
MDNKNKKNDVKRDNVVNNAVKEAQNITGVVVGEFPNAPGLINKDIGMKDNKKGRLE